MRQLAPAALMIALGVPQVHAGAQGDPTPEPQYGDSVSALDIAPDTVRLARYTTMAAGADPARLAPLETIVRLSIPAEVGEVGAAVRYVLLRTGYSLGERDEAAAKLLSLPLPQNHRELGPASVRELLAVLVGEAFVVVDDPVGRSIAIRLSRAWAVPDETPADLAAGSTAQALPVAMTEGPDVVNSTAPEGGEDDDE